LVKPARMQMWLHVAGGAWEIHVSDQGGGDPAVVDELIHPKDLPNLEDERGRGLFLIAQSVDSLAVQRSADGLGLELIAGRRFERRAGWGGVERSFARRPTGFAAPRRGCESLHSL